MKKYRKLNEINIYRLNFIQNNINIGCGRPYNFKISINENESTLFITLSAMFEPDNLELNLRLGRFKITGSAQL